MMKFGWLPMIIGLAGCTVRLGGPEPVEYDTIAYAFGTNVYNDSDAIVTDTQYRYGVQLERMSIGGHFNPEVGFVRRTDMRRNFGQLRYSARPTGLITRISASGSGSNNRTLWLTTIISSPSPTCPCSDAVSPRSASSLRTMAVDESATRNPVNTAACHATPSAATCDPSA